jgi:hypothetical protein
MKASFVRNAFLIATTGAFLGLSEPLFADNSSDAMMHQAEDMVHQALNPGGDAPSDAQRTELLTKALELLKDTPDKNYRKHRMKAIRDIKAALDDMKLGQPSNQVTNDIRDADLEIRTALSIK